MSNLVDLLLEEAGSEPYTTSEKLCAMAAARIVSLEQRIAEMRLENSKIRAALMVVHHKQEPLQ